MPINIDKTQENESLQHFVWRISGDAEKLLKDVEQLPEEMKQSAIGVATRYREENEPGLKADMAGLLPFSSQAHSVAISSLHDAYEIMFYRHFIREQGTAAHSS